MWWSAWSRHRTLMPVVPSRRRNSQARQSASRRLIASACFHHCGQPRGRRRSACQVHRLVRPSGKHIAEAARAVERVQRRAQLVRGVHVAFHVPAVQSNIAQLGGRVLNDRDQVTDQRHPVQPLVQNVQRPVDHGFFMGAGLLAAHNRNQRRHQFSRRLWASTISSSASFAAFAAELSSRFSRSHPWPGRLPPGSRRRQPAAGRPRPWPAAVCQVRARRRRNRLY